MAPGRSVTLSDGRELAIDLNRMTMREYRELFESAQPVEEGDATIAKVVGLTGDELIDLPQPDYRRIVQAVLKAAREPISDADDPKV